MGKRKLKQPKLIFKENQKIIVNYNNLYDYTATDPQLRRMRSGKYKLPDGKLNFILVLSFRIVVLYWCSIDIVFYIAIPHKEFTDVFHVEKIQY